MPDAYARAGVDVDANNRTAEWVRARLKRQQSPQLLGGIGGFSGLWALNGYRNPVLAASTDSVGTKIKVAIELKRYDGLGYDIVNHCVNDILVSGAQPLFFLDYLAVHKNDPDVVHALIGGVADACESCGISLLGGETAEMPDVYRDGDFDLAGTVVGAVEREHLIKTTDVRAGDTLLGFPSHGLHTNGYTLARRLFTPDLWHHEAPDLGCTYGEALLWPHVNYLADVRQLRSVVPVHGLAHITGGGLTDNVPRMLGEHHIAVIDLARLSLPLLFRDLLRRGQLEDGEALRTFNLGIGMVAAVAHGDVSLARATLPSLIELGTVEETMGDERIQYRGRLAR